MSEIRLITSSDEHLADVAPGFRKDDYRGEILEMLEWQGDFARKFGARALLRGGDFFHVKAANKTTMRTMAMAARIHRQYPCQTFALAGNHDMSNNHPESIPSQPLGVMLNSGVFQLLQDETFADGSLKARVIGVEYTTDIDVDGIHNLVRKKDENYTIAFVHALASMAPDEKIQSFFNERIFDYRDLVFEGCPDVYVFGHYHKDQGIVEHAGVKFVNLGSISRGSLVFENIERKPKISSIRMDSQGIHVEEHIIPHKDAHDIFDFELKKRLDTERRNLNEFVQQLRLDSKSMAESPVELLRQELSTTKFSEDLRRLCLQTLESAENGELSD